MGQRVFLIDGTAFCYRAFHAIRNLATADGRPTNAVYGVVMMLKALREKEHPDGLAVAFDTGKPTFRHKQFEQYKIQRKPMPDPLISQIPVVKKLLEAYRVPIFEREGYEGEDVLATIARRIASQGVEVFLVTGDKDALQLVNSHVKVYNPHKEQLVLDAEAVRSRYGLGPDQIVDLMALMGDDIDNIPGVPGVGEKTAVELLKQFGSLDSLYSHLDQVSQAARRKALEESKEQVQLARRLAQIDSSVPIDVSLADLKMQEPDWKALRSLFRELEFKRLLTDLDDKEEQTAPKTMVAVAVDAKTIESVLSALGSGSVAAIGCWPISQDEQAIGAASAQRVLAAIAVQGQPVWITVLDKDFLATSQGKRLAKWLEDPQSKKIGYDCKSVIRLIKLFKCDVLGIGGDVMVAAYLANPARANQSLKDLVDEYLDERLSPLPDSVDPMMANQPRSCAAFAHATGVLWQLHEKLQQVLKERALDELYTALELPLVAVLAEMEAQGISIDRGYLAQLKAKMDSRLLEITQEVYGLAGHAFNLNSPKQLAEVLFTGLKLPVIKRTKTGPSTDADVLRQLAQQHPLPKQLLEYRELSKLTSTYVEALPLLADAQGRIHTSFNQTATATGRLSSSEPNLQNIPIRTELGRSIRKAFVPGISNGLLVAADYSQIELRILAHLSGDDQLTEAFKQGRDIHRYTASLIYGVPEAEIQPSQRSAMKAVNFGILYGMTAHGLSKELGMTFEEAQVFIDAYFERYPKVRAYLDGQIAKARREGFVQTLLGRRRYIPEVMSTDMMTRQLGERMAINAPVQGTAADLIKRAMVEIAPALKQAGLKSRMALQVHDELIFESPKSELAALSALVKRIMEGAIELSVPLVVTIKAGLNWLDLAHVD